MSSSQPRVYDHDEEVQAERRRQHFADRRRQNSATSANSYSPYAWFDTAGIHVEGGMGGDGCVSFRREKGEPRGGPNGGRGGHGGSVYLQADTTMNTLFPLKHRVHTRAGSGRNGQGKNRDGCSADDVTIFVPPGTVVREHTTDKLAGELRNDGDRLLVARGGRGGRGNRAFLTHRRTAPKLAERGEPGAARWINLELLLVADVGIIGLPNAGKSTLLAAASAARPKIADYPFTTLVPNLGVCNLQDDGKESQRQLVLCDIPGLIEGASDGAGMGDAFLRHVQRCSMLLHMVDGTAADPVQNFRTIQGELQKYDDLLAQKPQVVVLNKLDAIADQATVDQLVKDLRQAAGHSRVLAISAATTERVQELMRRTRTFVEAQSKPSNDDENAAAAAAVDNTAPSPLLGAPEVDWSRAGLEADSDDFQIVSDPSYPGQWRVKGAYIEQVAKMTHWEYPEAIERFGRQLDALGISEQLTIRGAQDGDLIMIDQYDFDFSPQLTNVYIPPELLEEEEERRNGGGGTADEEPAWRPFPLGGFMDVDTQEFDGFGETDDWDLLEGAMGDDDDDKNHNDDDDDIWNDGGNNGDDNDDNGNDDGEFVFDADYDEVWTSS